MNSYEKEGNSIPFRKNTRVGIERKLSLFAFLVVLFFEYSTNRKIIEQNDFRTAIRVSEAATGALQVASEVIPQRSFPHDYTHNRNQSYASNFTWIGKRFLPPKTDDIYDPNPAENYHPRDMMRIFARENTLWIGDSTQRQDFHTMFGILNHTYHDNQMHPLISVGAVSDNINKAKFSNDYVFYCPARRVPGGHSKFFRELGQVPGTDALCFDGIDDPPPIHWKNTAPDGDWSFFRLPGNNSNSTSDKNDNTRPSTTEQSGKGKFDYGVKECFQSIVDKTLKAYSDLFQREYTVLILSNAMWELSTPQQCGGKKDGDQEESRIQTSLLRLLEELRKLSGPDLFVVWKVHGHANDPTILERSIRLQDTARDWFSKAKPPYMDLADFGYAVKDRSVREDRLGGHDLPVHWGPEGRLASIDIITHVVDLKQRRQAQQAQEGS